VIHAILIHREAAEEFVDASLWYEKKSPAVASRFDAEVWRALDCIAEKPATWPPHGSEHRHFVLRGFPYLVIYLETDRGPVVVAIAHGSRREDYWRDRRPDDAKPLG
jgi:toxin ParE1/3/4